MNYPSVSERKNSTIYPGTATHTSGELPVRAYKYPQAAWQEWQGRSVPARGEFKDTTHVKHAPRKR